MAFKLMVKRTLDPGCWRAAVCLLVSYLLIASAVQAQNYYRYKNSEGQVVIDMSVPPEYIADGYEVLNPSGNVIEVVPPHKPIVKDVEQIRVNAEQQREDQMLLRSYSSTAEIESAKERRLSQLQREVDIVETNQAKNKKLLEEARSKVANLQRAGRPVPDTLLSHIDELALQISESDQLKALRQQEYQAVNEKYGRYIRRFAELKGLPSP